MTLPSARNLHSTGNRRPRLVHAHALALALAHAEARSSRQDRVVYLPSQLLYRVNYLCKSRNLVHLTYLTPPLHRLAAAEPVKSFSVLPRLPP